MSNEDFSRRLFLIRSLTGISSAYLALRLPEIVAAQEHAHQAAQAAAPTKFEFLTPEQAVEIEAIAARILDAIARVEVVLAQGAGDSIDPFLWEIAAAIRDQVGVLRRIPEHMDSTVYYRTFRPYIRFFENVTYEGIEPQDSTLLMNFRGETGAQSSIMPTLVAFMKIPHKPSMLTNHLADMRNYMPAEHRMLIERVEAMPAIRGLAGKEPFNAILDVIAEFRSIHYGWAQEYINRWTTDPRGTGGTPYMQWLDQLIQETRSFKIV